MLLPASEVSMITFIDDTNTKSSTESGSVLFPAGNSGISDVHEIP